MGVVLFRPFVILILGEFLHTARLFKKKDITGVAFHNNRRSSWFHNIHLISIEEKSSLIYQNLFLEVPLENAVDLLKRYWTAWLTDRKLHSHSFYISNLTYTIDNTVYGNHKHMCVPSDSGYLSPLICELNGMHISRTSRFPYRVLWWRSMKCVQ